MKPGFYNSNPLVKGVGPIADGRNFSFQEPVYYLSIDGKKLCIPIGATTDGASTPQVIWNVIPPFGKGWLAYALHDAAYRNTLLWLDDLGNWHRAAFEKSVCDGLLDEAMIWCGVGKIERDAIFDGVVLGGTSSFEGDRNAVFPPIVETGLSWPIV